MRLYHASTVRVENPDTQHSRPNHQMCLLSDALIENRLHFVTAEEI